MGRLTSNSGRAEAGSKTYEKYGEALEVPGFNSLTDEPQELHLWYLLDDSAVLRNCLLQGIDRWGKLESYLKHGGILDGLGKKRYKFYMKKTSLLNGF